MSTKNISSFFKRNHEAVPKDIGESKSECTKVYNAQNIIEAEQIVELLKENHIPRFFPGSRRQSYDVRFSGIWNVRCGCAGEK